VAKTVNKRKKTSRSPPSFLSIYPYYIMERESQETLNSSSKFEFKIECHSE